VGPVPNKVCEDCGDEIPAKRMATICVACQGELEKAGVYVKARLEIYQELNGWQLEGLNQILIPGGKRR
jgi:RNA polymerase-binding transcription factor DksA